MEGGVAGKVDGVLALWAWKKGGHEGRLWGSREEVKDGGVRELNG